VKQKASLKYFRFWIIENALHIKILVFFNYICHEINAIVYPRGTKGKKRRIPVVSGTFPKSFPWFFQVHLRRGVDQERLRFDCCLLLRFSCNIQVHQRTRKCYFPAFPKLSEMIGSTLNLDIAQVTLYLLF